MKRISDKALEDFARHVRTVEYEPTIPRFLDWLNELIDNPNYISDTHDYTFSMVGIKQIPRYKLYEEEVEGKVE